MRPRNVTTRMLALLLILSPSLARAGQAGSDDGRTVWRLFPVHYIDMREAGLLIQERLPEMLMTDHEVRYEGIGGADRAAKPMGYLRILADPEYLDRIAEILAEVDQPSATRMFHIIVLQTADNGSEIPDLPPGAQTALKDLKSLLPFEDYRLIDSALVRSSGRADVSLEASYAIEFKFRVGPSEKKPLHIDNFLLYSKLPESTPSHLRTSFSMDVGETVVVGTSRPFEEDAALVVLMTALE